MLEQKTFGAKLRNHRKNLGMTQEEVAEIIGVSAQAISKWEAGDCLPDCFNLKAISDVYKVSLDILLETESNDDIEAVSNKIEQLGDEFIWAKQSRDIPNIHRDLGDDLWQMWKGLYFIETGDKKAQAETKQQGNLRVCSEYGMKIWDDDGIACVIKSTLKDKINIVSERDLSILHALCSKDGIALIAALDSNILTPKSALIEKTSIEIHRLNELLLLLTESKVIEFVSDRLTNKDGYKMCAYCGITAYMILASAYILAKPNCWVSEYIDRD